MKLKIEHKWRLIPLFFFIVLLAFFTRGLFLKPQELPSVKIGKNLPNISLPTLDGASSDLSSLDNSTYLLIVWASWCEACNEEQSFLLKLKQQNIILIGLNYKDQPAQAREWLSTWHNPYKQVLLDQDGNYSMELGVYGAPETFLIGPNRQIIYRHTGVLSQKIWDKEFLPRMKSRIPS